MNSFTRLTGERLYEIRYQLSSVAFDIIDTSTQIARLHFTAGTSLSRVRVRNITLRRMTELGVLVRWRKPNGGLGGGSDAYCYALDRAGQMIAFPDKPHYWREPYPSAPFLNHRLMVTELYVLYQEASRSGWTLRSFEPEPMCWRRTSLYDNKRSLRPDVYLVMSDGKWRYYWFIEVDMSTERLERIKDKLKLYHDYYQSGREQHERKIFPAVLFLVLDERRKQQIHDLIRRQPKIIQRIARVELQEYAHAAITGSANAI